MNRPAVQQSGRSIGSGLVSFFLLCAASTAHRSSGRRRRRSSSTDARSHAREGAIPPLFARRRFPVRRDRCTYNINDNNNNNNNKNTKRVPAKHTIDQYRGADVDETAGMLDQLGTLNQYKNSGRATFYFVAP